MKKANIEDIRLAVEENDGTDFFFWLDPKTRKYVPWLVSMDDVRRAKAVLTSARKITDELKGVIPIAWALFHALKPVIDEGHTPVVMFYGRQSPRIVVTLQAASMELLKRDLPPSIGGIDVTYQDAQVATQGRTKTQTPKPRHKTHLRPIKMILSEGNNFSHGPTPPTLH